VTQQWRVPTGKATVLLFVRLRADSRERIRGKKDKTVREVERGKRKLDESGIGDNEQMTGGSRDALFEV
jgi:hypothetical protein